MNSRNFLFQHVVCRRHGASNSIKLFRKNCTNSSSRRYRPCPNQIGEWSELLLRHQFEFLSKKKCFEETSDVLAYLLLLRDFQIV